MSADVLRRHASVTTKSRRLMTHRDRCNLRCILATTKDHSAQETDPPAIASLANRRLT